MALTDNILSYYKLNESSGNAVDSVSANNLTNTNVTYATGKIQNGAVFDGASNRSLKRNSIATLTSFSVSFLVKFSAFGSVIAIVDKLSTTASGFRIWAGTTWGGLLLTMNGTSWAISFTPTVGQWYHFVWTYSGGTAKLYKDGNTTPFDTKTGLSLTDGGNQFCLGNRSNNDKSFNGMLDEVGLWTRELSSSEVAELYNGGNGLDYPFLIKKINGLDKSLAKTMNGLSLSSVKNINGLNN